LSSVLGRRHRKVTKLGNPHAAEAAKLARARLKANADLAARRVAGVINSVIERGITTNAAIAAELNSMDVARAAVCGTAALSAMRAGGC
jgi:hypothetical protein